MPRTRDGRPGCLPWSLPSPPSTSAHSIVYGSKSVRGTEVAALFYTLLESAKLAGVEPHEYLMAAAKAALAGEPPLLPHVHRQNLKAA